MAASKTNEKSKEMTISRTLEVLCYIKRGFEKLLKTEKVGTRRMASIKESIEALDNAIEKISQHPLALTEKNKSQQGT